MSVPEIILAVAFVLWLMVCVLTATLKSRGMGWGIAAAFFPPLYLVLLLRGPGTSRSPERVRCPLCQLGWVPLDRLPRICTGCKKEISYADLQREMHKDMM